MWSCMCAVPVVIQNLGTHPNVAQQWRVFLKVLCQNYPPVLGCRSNVEALSLFPFQKLLS